MNDIAECDSLEEALALMTPAEAEEALSELAADFLEVPD